jgi:hypothetical protein
MANPISILLGGGGGHEQRLAEMSQAAGATAAPTPPDVSAPQQPMANPTAGAPSFLSSAVTTPPAQNRAKSLLGA